MHAVISYTSITSSSQAKSPVMGPLYEIDTAPPTIGTPKDAATLRALLKAPFESVYKISTDGSTFLEPLLLRGTPLQEPESEKKREAAYRSQLNPSNKSLQLALKRYRDNSSKFKKIREVFGEQSRYHPNQLLGKDYLPPGGLCQKEAMYRLACKISDLKHLHRTGALAMDPFDFIRWRILKKAASFMLNPVDNAKHAIRTIVYKLCDDSVDIHSKVYQDTVMRQAVLMSAAQRNQLGNYGPKGRQRKHWLTEERVSPVPLARRIERRLGARGRTRVAAASSTPIYAGVNAFRAQQQQRREAQRRQEAEARQSIQERPDAS
ncbi:hypothetical protein BBK36DRAFT_1204143 [Trichoderma citrinoviride]|uniref:Uncharacterized protein n=1 Tax=Trichoderma citrinoviride TaxID=58853 RepID=A0A2T4B719_9HYPO|nr:hypothetical protein BBK36DRAFT_1204143 [Trichoderma citrinoviride]PTB65078.1 hypothetical protein BBK36DRAFT_1204143 [Trichoderma citrinoviride]